MTTEQLLQEYVTTIHSLKLLDAKKEELKDLILTLQPEEIPTSFEVIVKNVLTDRLDSKALKDELPKVWQRFVKTSSSIRVTVKKL